MGRGRRGSKGAHRDECMYELLLHKAEMQRPQTQTQSLLHPRKRKRHEGGGGEGGGRRRLDTRARCSMLDASARWSCFPQESSSRGARAIAKLLLRSWVDTTTQRRKT